MDKKLSIGIELSDEELMEIVGGTSDANAAAFSPEVTKEYRAQPLYGIKPRREVQPLYGIKPVDKILPLYGVIVRNINE